MTARSAARCCGRADEPWPTCGGDDDFGTAHEGPTPLVPIVQVHRADAPGVPFPPGRDLLQVLWCPFDHGEFCYPLPQVHWRSAAAVGEVAPTPPPPAEASEDYVPNPCAVHPEEVTEYPGWDLPQGPFETLRARFDRLRDETGSLYQYHLADAPGIKLGGYPGWTQEPCWPDCDGCGQRMEHLLSCAQEQSNQWPMGRSGHDRHSKMYTPPASPSMSPAAFCAA
ncbi:hypothetical protein OHT93_30430 [Streptomyces sp. NBC_00191]|uniref:hypothetical protein n=1 Tax=Streptomyces sp. NBC_00191 TaxID=2975674 RepID=UPI003251ECB4